MEREKILIVDDEINILTILTAILKEEGYDIRKAATPDEAKELVRKWRPDLVILDLVFKGYEENGIDVLRFIKNFDPYIQVLILTGHGSIDSAVEATKLGAYNYLTKPLKLEEIRIHTKRALETRKVNLENLELKKELERYRNLEELNREIIGNNEKFRQVLEMARKVARTDATVLITGESGTGKELVARYIHNLSKRARNKFVAVNIGAIPEEIVESELFGYEKGAFTGADKKKIGFFKEADGGTIFLDEIGEASKKLQVRLLRVLQYGEFYPLGSTKLERVDIRVIAATNKDLLELVKEKKFREDLYYRLNVIHIDLPPLRERKDDIPLLVNHFLKKFAEKYGSEPKTITRRALNALINYSWPGNIRELENVIESMFILTPGDTIDIDALPRNIKDELQIDHISEEDIDAMTPESVLTLDEVERRYILKALEVFNWNRKKAAEALGIDASTLYRKLKSYGITPPDR